MVYVSMETPESAPLACKENSDSSTVLKLVQQQLRDIPSFVLDLKNLQQLSLDYNRLTNLPAEFCCKLQVLKILSLDGNHLNALPENISNMSQLKELSLSENNLHNLPDSLSLLLELKSLKIVGNRLKKLPDDFGNLSNLKKLSVDENCLKELPDSFSNLLNLESFDAGCNKLKTLPTEFGKLQSLQYLDVNSNCLKTLPSSFSKLGVLKIIDLSDNELNTLPKDLCSAQTLIKLYIDNNKLSEIPSWFSKLANTEEISMRNNFIRNAPFPDDFGKYLFQLRQLDLRGNYISALPESMENLKSLEIIDMGSSLRDLERKRSLFNGNFLTKLPRNFGFIGTLREVHLDENVIEILPENFGDLVNMEILDLSHNHLQVLPESFCNLKSLSVCMLSMNYLVELPQNFGQLLNLNDLRLDNNMLKDLPASFSSLAQLQSLDLFCNSLKEVPTALKYLTNLKRLDMHLNEFNLPEREIPDMSFQAEYKETNSSLKDNWRGRRRPDIQDHQITPRNEEDQKTLQHLQEALEQGLSFWQKHGQDNSDRHPGTNGDSDYMHSQIENSSYPEKCTSSNYSDSHSEDGEEENTWDPSWNIAQGPSEPEVWELDNDRSDPFGYFEDCNEPSILPEESQQEVFVPARELLPPICVNRVWTHPVQGQFDDAE